MTQCQYSFSKNITQSLDFSQIKSRGNMTRRDASFANLMPRLASTRTATQLTAATTVTHLTTTNTITHLAAAHRTAPVDPVYPHHVCTVRIRRRRRRHRRKRRRRADRPRAAVSRPSRATASCASETSPAESCAPTLRRTPIHTQRHVPD